MRKRREGKKWNETEIKCKDKKWDVKQKVGKRQNSRIENKETWKSKTKKEAIIVWRKWRENKSYKGRKKEMKRNKNKRSEGY